MKKLVILMLVITSPTYTIFAQRSSNVKLYALAGWATSTFDFEPAFGALLTETQYATTFSSPQLGAGFLYGNRRRQGFNLQGDLQFSSAGIDYSDVAIQSPTYTRTETIAMKYFRTKMSFGPRLTFLDKNVTPFIGAGLVFNFFMTGKCHYYQLRDYSNNPDVIYDFDEKINGFRLFQVFTASGLKANLSEKLTGILEFRYDFLGNNSNSAIDLNGNSFISHRSVKSKTLQVSIVVIF
jgi:hypothetical protein